MRRTTILAAAALALGLATTPAPALADAPPGDDAVLVADLAPADLAAAAPATPHPAAVVAPVAAAPPTDADATAPGTAEGGGPSQQTDAGAGAAITVPIPDLAGDPLGWLASTYDAVRSGEWILAAALLVILLVYAARRWGGEVWPWLATDRGGVALAGATSMLGAVAHAALAGEGLPGADAWLAAATVAVAAMGGWTGVRKLLWPKDGEG